MNYSNYADARLIEGMRKSDDFAFNELHKRYRSLLLIEARKLTGDYYTAEDLVQELFLKIWEKRSKLTPIENVVAYLARSLRYLFIDNARKSKSYDEKHLPLSADIEAGYHIIDESKQDELLIESLKKNIEKLPASMREMAIMCLNGLSNEQIAMQLNKTEDNVRKQLYNAIRQLKSMAKQSFFLNIIWLILLIKKISDFFS